MKITDKYVFFWGNQSTFSNWYLESFQHAGVWYNCSEQFMMQQKALLFKDYEQAEIIMRSPSPRDQKALGRGVYGFDRETWMRECIDIMVPGLVSKFTQSPKALQEIINSGDRIIVEASPTDRIWGIGMKQNDEGVEDQSNWKGLNLLGTCLMKSRIQVLQIIQTV